MTDQELWQRAVKSHEAGQLDRAEADYRAVLASNGFHPGATYMLGRLFEDRGDDATALGYHEIAMRQAPQWLDPALGWIRIVSAQGRLAEIEKVLATYAPAHHRDIRLHRAAAGALTAGQQTARAILALRQVATFPQATAQDWIALGDGERRMGDYVAAVNAYSKAWTADNTLTDAAINAGALCQTLQQPQDAARWYDAAYAAGARGEWLYQFAEALRAAGEIEGWLKFFDALPAAQKQTLQGQRLSLEIAQFRGDLIGVGALKSLSAAPREEQETDALDEAGFVRLYFDQSPDEHKAFYRRVNAANAVAHVAMPSPAEPAVSRGSDRPLRIGYLSPDFRDHVMGRMAAVMIENRTVASHKAFCYALNFAEDAVTARIVKSADNYVRCGHATDEVIANRIAADRLDVLIDLAGPTYGGRSGVLARKPAPVIITHIAAAGPVGLETVDFKLTDTICDPAENQAYLIEKLLPMAGCCYPVPKYPLPTAGLTKAQLGLEGRVTFGAFYTHLKLSERCLRLWKQVLDAVPEGVLVFSPLDAKLRPAYENLTREVGIDSSRIHFLAAGPTEAERLARYRVIDVVLDSMPYGGVNGTLESLYMGVPVVSLLGQHHCERTTASMLNHLGVIDTIAQSPSEYVSLARKISADASLRADLSTRIRARWPKFADPTDYVRRWEAVLRQVAR